MISRSLLQISRRHYSRSRALEYYRYMKKEEDPQRLADAKEAYWEELKSPTTLAEQRHEEIEHLAEWKERNDARDKQMNELLQDISWTSFSVWITYTGIIIGIATYSR